MLWTIDLDDFGGVCQERFPILTAAKDSLLNSNTSSNVICRNDDIIPIMENKYNLRPLSDFDSKYLKMFN